jgi:hypothetical protein
MKQTNYLTIGLLIVLLAACQTVSPTQSLPTTTVTENFPALSGSITPIPTVVIASKTSTPIPPDTPIASTMAATHTSQATDTPIPTITAIPSTTPLPSPTLALGRIEHYWLQRPIAQEESNVHWIDRTYPYGGTQFGEREVHLGVEFFNPRFTSIYAAADGLVLQAGDDSNVRFGPEFNYYGNLVIIEHPFTSPDGLPVYTLYAHMQDLAVQKDEVVIAGQRIGRVGDTGIAVGPHLHFEVRLGNAFNFHNTRNPVLWIQPYVGFGTLAGRVTGIDNPYGIVLSIHSDTVQRETYSYGSDRVNSDVAWNENFTLGDLPSDNYQVTVSNRNGRTYFREQISIVSGQTAWLEVDLSGTDYQQ